MSSLKCPESGEKIKKMKVISLILSLLIVIGSMTLLSGCANLISNRTEIVIISDIHLGADDSFAETKENKDELAVF